MKTLVDKILVDYKLKSPYTKMDLESMGTQKRKGESLLRYFLRINAIEKK